MPAKRLQFLALFAELPLDTTRTLDPFDGNTHRGSPSPRKEALPGVPGKGFFCVQVMLSILRGSSVRWPAGRSRCGNEVIPLVAV